MALLQPEQIDRRENVRTAMLELLASKPVTEIVVATDTDRGGLHTSYATFIEGPEDSQLKVVLRNYQGGVHLPRLQVYSCGGGEIFKSDVTHERVDGVLSEIRSQRSLIYRKSVVYLSEIYGGAQ